MISSDQIRAARSLLALSQTVVAEAAGVSVPTLKRAEGSGKIQASAKAIAAIRNALEASGIEFIDENGGGAGVRMREGK